jgi:ABC-type nitrate/sulfonate/bicarbonate transport system permease component
VPRARSAPWLGLIVPLALVAFWEYQATQGALPQYLPAPSVVAAQWVGMVMSGELLGHAGISMFRALSGFAIGGICGSLIGLLAAAYRPVNHFYEPIISLTYPVPKVAALPIIFAWFGLGEVSKIVTVTISVFFPLYISMLAGAQSTPRVHVWAARNMGAGAAQIVFKVLLPNALPQLFNGLRVGLALSFVVMFVAEMVSSQKGLGYLVVFAEHNMRVDMMFVALITIGIIGFTADRLLLAVRHRLLVGQLVSTEFQQ